MASGDINVTFNRMKILIFSAFIFGLTLFTNQYFHGGVIGKLHNKSVSPKVEISHVNLTGNQLQLQVYRVEGVDVYGSFLIRIEILDEDGNLIKAINQEELSNFPIEKIKNHYVAKVKPGKYSLILPLGAKADLFVDIDQIDLSKKYLVKLIDISGKEWTEKVN